MAIYIFHLDSRFLFLFFFNLKKKEYNYINYKAMLMLMVCTREIKIERKEFVVQEKFKKEGEKKKEIKKTKQAIDLMA